MSHRICFLLFRAISKLPQDIDNLKSSTTKSLKSAGLTHRQTRLLRKDETLAPVVKEAAGTVIAACTAVFNQSRWNCSSLGELPHISPELRIGKDLSLVPYLALTFCQILFRLLRD